MLMMPPPVALVFSGVRFGGGFDLVRLDGFEVDDAGAFIEAPGARKKVFMEGESFSNPGAQIA
ncbi:MAG: hypothetical protein CMH76_01920 [Nitrospinae bacterium]|jgi:hypothetical protein|nr:hypothetical protein [Nitrospinota bacterium]